MPASPKAHQRRFSVYPSGLGRANRLSCLDMGYRRKSWLATSFKAPFRPATTRGGCGLLLPKGPKAALAWVTIAHFGEETGS